MNLRLMVYKQLNTVNLLLSLSLDHFPRPVLDFERGRSYPVECMAWKGELKTNALITKMQLVTSKPFNTYNSLVKKELKKVELENRSRSGERGSYNLNFCKCLSIKYFVKRLSSVSLVMSLLVSLVR